ncbi:hypothetical protein XELAEV_18037703mg [Xenopus laevis]|uniref:Uncharacterized protein n=1 Tax=Xenopus laevis TaxID=8355 RepID=A0A974CCL3_XENLA|nr:hypothetical protein XELAEV_18037703mg [Xenopus laevis]
MEHIYKNVSTDAKAKADTTDNLDIAIQVPLKGKLRTSTYFSVLGSLQQSVLIRFVINISFRTKIKHSYISR